MNLVAPVTQGVTDASVELGAFRLTETSHVPNTRLPAHQHAHPAVTFVLSGAFRERFGAGRDLSCTTMTVLRKPAGATHSNEYSSVGARSFILECLSASPLYDGLRDCTPRFGLVRAVPRMLELYDAFWTGAPERLMVAEEVALEMSYEASGAIAARSTRPPRWLSGIAERIDRECLQPLSLAALAEDVAVHPVYLARVFRRHYGQSVGGYALQCRLRRSMDRLATSATRISQIAHECGFADQSHFTRLFSREAGVSPARFRRAASASIGTSAWLQSFKKWS